MIRLDHHLITAFVERWRQETHTFHLTIGEATITLQDVSVLLGLPVDGQPIIRREHRLTVEHWQGLCAQLLGVAPPADQLDSGRVRLAWLCDTFDALPDGADEVIVQRHARAYILRLLGGVLMSDLSQTLVRLSVLPFLEDLDAAGRCSWGSATLAWLYRSLCRATRPDAKQISGALLLLQVFYH